MQIISIISQENISKNLELIRNDFYSEGYELRLDLIFKIISNKSVIKIQEILNKIKIKNKIVIITLRDKNQGGEYLGSFEEKLEIYNQIAKDNEDYNNLYFDFEYYINKEILEQFINKNPENKIIYSYHNFTLTPKSSDLHGILKAIICKNINKKKIIYKIVSKARNSLDSLELIAFLQNAKSKDSELNIITHCMGRDGEFSRIINGIYGSEFTYGFLNQEQEFLNKNIGCISTEDLNNIYQINKLNKSTKIYALLGDPVSHSIGHIFHNKYFSNLNLNSIYLKINLLENELDEFFKKIKAFNFYGLSITMPLKESVFKYISNKEDFKLINAINTIKIKNNNVLVGRNTDGLGAYLALNHLKNLCENNNFKFLFIGSGGAVEGIINELISKLIKCNILILNRTLKNAEKIKSKFKQICLNYNSTISVISFEELSNNNNFFEKNIKNQDLFVINAISNSNIKDNIKDNINIKSLFNKIFNAISNKSIVMDINYYNDILDLIPNNIKAINGNIMFHEQARLQQEFWSN